MPQYLGAAGDGDKRGVPHDPLKIPWKIPWKSHGNPMENPMEIAGMLVPFQ
jgi:hypothetical protein